MGYVKYTEEQLVERKMAQAAIQVARALLKSLREAKKAKKDGVIQLRRELKAEIRRRKEAGLEARRLAREEKALNKKCKPILVVLRKVYKPYLVARRKLARLRVAKRKAVLAADRKLARETAKAAKHQLELKIAEEWLGARATEQPKEQPKKQPKEQPKKLKMRRKSIITNPGKHSYIRA